MHLQTQKHRGATIRQHHAATVLVPFATLDGVAGAVPKIVASGVGPLRSGRRRDGVTNEEELHVGRECAPRS